jgi:hypothetical protein
VSQAGAIEYLGPSGEPGGAHVRLERIADLADALVEQLGAVGDRYEQLQRTLEEPTLPGPRALGSGSRRAEDVRRGVARNSHGPPVDDAARLVVMDMAITGSTREQTKEYMRDIFGLENGDAIVDEVFDSTEATQRGPRHRRLFARRP